MCVIWKTKGMERRRYQSGVVVGGGGRTAFCLFSAALFLLSSVLADVVNRSELTTLRSISRSSDHPVEISCAEIRHLFAAKSLGSIDLVPTHPINGTDLQICASQQSCCSQVVEIKFKEIVKEELLSIVQSTSSFLRNLLMKNNELLQERFLDLIKISENKTTLIFDELYKKMASHSQELITKMFDNLSDFLNGRDTGIDVADTVDAFFDSLFPIVYHRILHPKLKDVNEDYKSCLEQTRKEIKPFGDIPTDIAVMLAKSFETTRTFLNALHLGVEVLETLNNVEVASECEVALHKLLYCPKCQGLVDIRACNGYCSNVIRGCLANVAEMDQPWHDFLKALEKLAAGMESGSVMNNVVSELPTKISEAVMRSMENGPKISKKVKNVCGPPKSDGHDYVLEVNMTVDASAMTPQVTDTGLYTIIREFMKSLGQSKNFFAGLADDVCKEDSLAVQSESNCWNGQTLGEYTKTIAGVGLSAQKYNPELKLQTFKDAKFILLIDKLKQMRKTLDARAVLLPEKDAILVNDGSGSGWGGGGYNGENFDDEDYDGSGSGDYPEENVVQPRHGTGPVTNDPDLDFGDDGSDKTPSIETRPSGAHMLYEPKSWLLFLPFVVPVVTQFLSRWTSG